MTKNLEHKFSMLIREIRKEHIGNGPREINTRIVGPWVICEMKGNLTNVEKFMIKSKEGQIMVHEARTELVKNIYKDPIPVNKLEEMMDAKVVSIFTDIDIEIDTAMTVFVFDKPIMVNSESKN
ncbi:DUF2294 domain-containing protein [Metabacillus sediminilitoris]|uniref:DUF2294 domain-containing protein n=1 Tax=Metabacillus sediminilitoris TaxID=2567941 RepID=A0A4S4BP55_9BACI|nr:DUF2294 domain-containing protein [Metabacillus sediminilitoris]QGQ45572.1 DUF2294 family protein [Metabacillus sediminilitoris]THF76637.1 DUF2294 domain-containing protein [Metabacillus sediminilitoris]